MGFGIQNLAKLKQQVGAQQPSRSGMVMPGGAPKPSRGGFGAMVGRIQAMKQGPAANSKGILR